jgi:hypothetical protein
VKPPWVEPATILVAAVPTRRRLERGGCGSSQNARTATPIQWLVADPDWVQLIRLSWCSMQLDGFLPPWDFERRTVDVGPMVAWARRTLAAEGIVVDDLARLHEVVDHEGAIACSRLLTARSLEVEPRRLMRAMVKAVLPEVPLAHTAVQACGHVRVLVPGDARTPSPNHTDAAVGHALDERTLWIALTDAFGTACLQGISLAESVGPDAERRRRGELLFEADQPLLRPLPVGAGEVLLFTPLHIHGACTNREATTRMSIDIRVAPFQAAHRRNPFVWQSLLEEPR